MQNKRPEFVPNQAKWRIASAVAAVAGLFTLVLASLLIINCLQIRVTDPLDNPELLTLREQLAASTGNNEALIEQIRALDLLVRKAFFTSQAQLQLGGRLLMVGAIVFLVAFRLAARWNPVLPSPVDAPDTMKYWRILAQSRELITGVAVVLVLVTLVAAYMTPFDIPVPGMEGKLRKWRSKRGRSLTRRQRIFPAGRRCWRNGRRSAGRAAMVWPISPRRP
ncbi:MAG: hypothetical protein ACOX5J_00170 [Candidatus Hydrogenedentales bacterium]